MIRVVNASADWGWEQLQPYVEHVRRLLGKLQDRFPDDLSVKSLTMEVISGRKCLWLILDDERLIATAMTAIETLDATGVRVVRLMDLAGSDIGAWAEPLRKAIETHGDENGVDYYAIEGRDGWGRLVEQWGYRKHAVLWRKRART